MKGKIEYSIVVPVYNEEGNIPQLDKEIKQIMGKTSKEYEVIYVNDASTDNSLAELKKLSKVKIINLNRNYGQSTALDAGFKEARGELIISMDGDLQNDPSDIPQLIKKLKDEKLDVVAGWRKNRKDGVGINLLSRTGKLLRSIILKDPIHDSGCMLRVYKKEAIKTLDLQGEMHRYILALLRWKGFKIGEVVVNHRPRINGKTNYGYSKAVRGFLDLMYMSFIQKYYQRPLHAFGYLSIVSFVLGCFSGGYSIYQKVFQGLGLNRNGWFFLGIFFMLGALMLFSFGILMDLLIKIYLNTSQFDKRYYIKEIIER